MRYLVRVVTVALSLLPVHAFAAPITFTLTATLSADPGTVPVFTAAGISLADPLVYTATFDPDTFSETVIDPTYSRFTGTIASTFAIGSRTGGGSTGAYPSYIDVANDFAGLEDAWGFSAFFSTGNLTSGYVPWGLTAYFSTPDLLTFSSTSLAATFPTAFLLPPAPGALFQIFLPGEDNVFPAYLDNITISVGPSAIPTPEPASMVLLASGLVGTVMARRRRRVGR